MSGIADVMPRFTGAVCFDGDFEVPFDLPTFRGRTRGGDEVDCFIVGLLGRGGETRSKSTLGVGGSSASIWSTAHFRFSSSRLRRSVCYR